MIDLNDSIIFKTVTAEAEARHNGAVNQDQIAVHCGFVLGVEAFPAFDDLVRIGRSALFRLRLRFHDGFGFLRPCGGSRFRLFQQGIQLSIIRAGGTAGSQGNFIFVQAVQSGRGKYPKTRR